MSQKESKQRIKLRCEGSPVKMDGTVIECSADGKRIKVRFDGPQDDTVLYAYGDHKLVSNMTGGVGGLEPVEDPRLMIKGLWWEVI